MANKQMDPVEKLMGFRFKSHPWHGVEIGENAPEVVMCYIEMVPTDTVKYEVDKVTGYLKIDRPQKYSNSVPALYGFIPRTYSADRVADLSREKTGNGNIVGDSDPLDICVLTEKQISHGDILVRARPIGGFRMIDNNQADDKLIAVMNNDALYEDYRDVSDLPVKVVNRLRHYFLTYKDLPGNPADVEITHVYGRAEAMDLIERSIEDYQTRFEHLDNLISRV
jgi:inorganic pyrophosphatase